MPRPIDSTNPVAPSIARMTEEAAKQKAVATQEKRELAGEGDFKDAHLDNLKSNPNALLENPLQVSFRRSRVLWRTRRTDLPVRRASTASHWPAV